jgi:hydrogenase maturation protease
VRGFWEELERPGPDAVEIDGVEIRVGSRVRLRPRARSGDAFDLALAGRTAVVAAIETDLDDRVQLAVTVDDDPGRDLGDERRPAHRFFFAPDELEPLGRILVAGIGNVFLGDDGWGVALAARLAQTALPAGVEVVDFGIRGMDLAYALGDGWEAVVLLDAVPRGEPPGTLSVIEPHVDADAVVVDAHGMDPASVLVLARTLGRPLPRVLVIGCEPLEVMTGEEDDVVADLSEPVRAALDAGVRLVGDVLEDLMNPRKDGQP